MTLETKHCVFYFRAFSHLEVPPGCLKRMSVIREGFGDLPGLRQHVVKDLQSPGSEEDGQTDVDWRDAAGGPESDINFLLPFGELSGQLHALWEARAEAWAGWHVPGNDNRGDVGSHLGPVGPRGAHQGRAWKGEEIAGPLRLRARSCPTPPPFRRMESEGMFEQKVNPSPWRWCTGNGEEGRLKVLSSPYATEWWLGNECWPVTVLHTTEGQPGVQPGDMHLGACKM